MLEKHMYAQLARAKKRTSYVYGSSIHEMGVAVLMVLGRSGMALLLHKKDRSEDHLGPVWGDQNFLSKF